MLVDRKKVLSELCKREFYFFLQTFWDTIIAEEPVYNWHLKYLCDELQFLFGFVERREAKPYDLIINIPPGSSKSTIATVMFPVWMWIRDPSIRIISLSHAGSLSLEHALKSRDILKSQLFKELFPDIEIRRDKDNKSNYENTAHGERIAASVSGGIIGRHAHIHIVDDPLDAKKSTSEATLKATDEAMKSLSTRKVDKELTPLVLIMQRLHEKDTTGNLLSKKNRNIKHICLPGELADNVNPVELRENYIDGLLDPIRLNREVLAEIKEDLGSYGYSGQVGQKPSPAEGGIFKKDWFNIVSWERFQELTKDKEIVWNFKSDGAYTEDKNNDPTGTYCSCFIDGKIFIRKFERVWQELPDYIKYSHKFLSENGYTNRSKFKIEPKASGLSIIQSIKEKSSINVMPYKFPKSGKVRQNDPKEVRARAASPSVESGRIYLIDGSWISSFLDEVTMFPNAAHDEAVDCLTMDVIENLFRKPKYVVS